MKTYLDCIPCFFKQTIEAARLAGAGKRKQKVIIDRVAEMLPKFSLGSTPPLMGWKIHSMVKRITKKTDPYAGIKEKSNALALKFYKMLKHKAGCSKDRLLAALELAIAGNIIDYGVKNTLNVDRELKKILKKEERVIKKEDKRIFSYRAFRQALKKARAILYLADNAGETVFDRILIEEIKRIYKDKRIIYAVKKAPIINDALISDARKCGIGKSAQIISSGTGAPGTILALCSKKFLKIFRHTDLVISKGQGNFEALSEEKRPIYFLFMAKCPVVAKDVGCNVGDIVLLGKRKEKR